MSDSIAKECPQEIVDRIGDPEANRLYALWTLRAKYGARNSAEIDRQVDAFVRQYRTIN
jgi:hypothetical protein